MTSVPLRRLALGGAAVGVLILTGCDAIRTDGARTAAQPTPLSDVVSVEQPFCVDTDADPGTGTTTTSTLVRPAAAARADAPSCAPYTGYAGPGSYMRFQSGGGGRLLVAVRVPEDGPDPTLRLRARPSVRFTPEPAAAEKLQGPRQAVPGTRWVGFRSDEIRFPLNSADTGDVVEATIAIPRGDARPAAVDVPTDLVLGSQVTADGSGTEYPADRPVVCDEALESDTVGADGNVSSTSCPTTGETELATVPTTDATIESPVAETTAAAGSTTTVPFRVARSLGAEDTPALSLTAETSVPGGSATPGTGELAFPVAPEPVEDPTTTEMRPAARAAAQAEATPGAETSDVPVEVAVPAGTPGGVYDVTLRTADEGGSRSATTRIRVPAAPAPVATTPATPAAPVPAATPRKPVTARPHVLRSVRVSRRTRRLHLGSVSCLRTSGTCAVSVSVKVGDVRIARITGTVKAGASKRLTVRLSRSALKRLIAGTGVATTTITSAGSDPIVRTTKVTAKRR